MQLRKNRFKIVQRNLPDLRSGNLKRTARIEAIYITVHSGKPVKVDPAKSLFGCFAYG